MAITSWIFAGQVMLSAQPTPLPTPTQGCEANSTSTTNVTALLVASYLMTTTQNQQTSETVATAISIGTNK